METLSEQPKRSPIWWRLLVGVSFALNLLVVGIVIGAITFGPGQSGRPGAELRAAGRLHLAAMLPMDARQDLRERLRVSEREDAPGSLRALAQQLDAALRAEPFVPAGVAVIMEERRQQQDLRAARVDAALVATLESMAPEEREVFADRVRRNADRRLGPPPGPPPR